MKRRLVYLSIVVATLLVLTVQQEGLAQNGSLAKPQIRIQVQGSSIEISWEAIEGAARYEVWQWTEADGWANLDDGNLTDITLTQADLTVGITYWYAVRAVAEGTTSDYSEYVSATIEAGASPTSTSTPISTQAADSGPTPYPTYTPYPTATSYPTYTPYPTATVPTVLPTVTPLPIEGDDPCLVIDHLSIFRMRLQPRSITAFVNQYGEAPEAREVLSAWFNPSLDRLEVGYRIRTSEGQYVMIWEYWIGCQYNGGILYNSDLYGNRVEE